MGVLDTGNLLVSEMTMKKEQRDYNRNESKVHPRITENYRIRDINFTGAPGPGVGRGKLFKKAKEPPKGGGRSRGRHPWNGPVVEQGDWNFRRYLGLACHNKPSMG
jgi:hypothetical protein